MKDQGFNLEKARKIDKANIFKGAKGISYQKVSPIGNHLLAAQQNPIPAKTDADKRILPAADFESSTKISDIAMLGSHDAGTYGYSKYRRQAEGTTPKLGGLLPGAFKSQSLNLEEQANTGVRYFDIRVNKGLGKSYHFVHSPSKYTDPLCNTSNDAVAETQKLINYAKKNQNQLFLIKLVIPHKDREDFFDKVFYSNRRNFIINNGKPLGTMTIGETIHQGKNIGIMYKDLSKIKEPSRRDKYLFDYKSSVNTEWGKTSDSKAMADFLTRRAQESDPNDDRITITQTNMPFSPRPFKGIKELATEGSKEIASSIESYAAMGINPGIISIDEVGVPESSETETYIKLNNQLNDRLVPEVMDTRL